MEHRRGKPNGTHMFPNFSHLCSLICWCVLQNLCSCSKMNGVDRPASTSSVITEVTEQRFWAKLSGATPIFSCPYGIIPSRDWLFWYSWCWIFCPRCSLIGKTFSPFYSFLVYLLIQNAEAFFVGVSSPHSHQRYELIFRVTHMVVRFPPYSLSQSFLLVSRTFLNSWLINFVLM